MRPITVEEAGDGGKEGEVLGREKTVQVARTKLTSNEVTFE